MKGITTTEKGDMTLLQWCMSAFNVVEHPQEGIYILLEGSMRWQDCTDTYELSPNELLFVRRGNYAVCTGDGSCRLLLGTPFKHISARFLATLWFTAQ